MRLGGVSCVLGVVSLVGCASQPERPVVSPVAAAAPIEAAPAPRGLITDEAEILRMLEAGETFVFVSMSTGCGATEGALETLAEVTSAPAPVPFAAIVYDPRTRPMEGAPAPLRRLMASSFYTVPSMHFIEDGELVDMSTLLVYRQGVERFLDRNMMTSTAPPARYDRIADAARRRHQVQLYGGLKYRDVSGSDLSHMTMVNFNYEGANLINADMSYVTLKNVNFAHADLRGVSFEGARFVGPVFWGRAICPDGTRADEHGFTCEGHLSGPLVAGIPRDALGVAGPTLLDQVLAPD
jgi:hypothetical protein